MEQRLKKRGHAPRYFRLVQQRGRGEEREDKAQLGLVHVGVPYSSSPNIKATFLAL